MKVAIIAEIDIDEGFDTRAFDHGWDEDVVFQFVTTALRDVLLDNPLVTIGGIKIAEVSKVPEVYR